MILYFMSFSNLHLIVLMLFISVTFVMPRQCNVKDPAVLRRINLKQVSGLWFGNNVLKPANFPDLSTVTYKDYTLDIKANGQAIVYGRLRAAIRSCNYQPVILKKFRKRKNSYITRFSFRNTTNEIRFLDIFEGRYLLFWGCILDDQNRCNIPFADVFSRKTSVIPNYILRKLNRSVMRALCVDVFTGFFKNIFEDRVCPRVEVIQDDQFGSENWFNIDVSTRSCRRY